MRAVLATALAAPVCAVAVGCAPSSGDTTSLPTFQAPRTITSTSVITKVTTPAPVEIVRTATYNFTVAVRYAAWLEVHNECRTGECQERARAAFPDVAHNPAARREYVRSLTLETRYSTPPPVTSRSTRAVTSVSYPQRADDTTTASKDKSTFAGAGARVALVVGGLLVLVLGAGLLTRRRSGAAAPRHSSSYVPPDLTLDDLTDDPRTDFADTSEDYR